MFACSCDKLTRPNALTHQLKHRLTRIFRIRMHLDECAGMRSQRRRLNPLSNLRRNKEALRVRNRAALQRVRRLSDKHAACVRRLNNILVVRVAGRAIVDVQDPVELDPHSEPQPDLTLLRPRPDFYASATPGPDDTLLVIEVGVSSVRFDREIKAPLYARAGVSELWLVDVDAGEVSVCRRPTASGYGDVTVRRRGDLLAPAALPDASLSVDEVLG